MAIRTYKVTLDSKNTIAPEPVYLRQGDKTGAVVIDATLMDNGSPVSLSGLTPMFKADTADGQAVIADSTGFTVIDSANGKFTYQVPNALSAIPGKITTAYFSLSDADGSESTFDVAFIIKAAVDISQAQADDYITIVDGTLNSLQKKIDAMNTDIQTILNAYNQGDFYNKSETDSRDVSTLTSAKTYTDNSLSGIVALPETFANLAAIQSKYPNGANGVMVAADNGHKYIWANSTWTDAGIYQSVGIADGSISLAKFDDSIKKSLLEYVEFKNYVGEEVFEEGKCWTTYENKIMKVIATDGASCPKIRIKANTRYSIRRVTNSFCYLGTDDDVLISKLSEYAGFTSFAYGDETCYSLITDTDCWLYMSYQTNLDYKNITVVDGKLPAKYYKYGIVFRKEISGVPVGGAWHEKIVVDKGGSGDYKDLNTAMMYVTDGDALHWTDIILKDGEHLITKEITIPDYCCIIGESGNRDACIVNFVPTDTSDYAVATYSAFRMDKNSVLKNFTLKAINCRYCVHSDSSNAIKDWVQTLKNMKMEHLTNTSGSWESQTPWGEGASSGSLLTATDCIFIAHNANTFAFSVHNNSNFEKPFRHVLSKCEFYSENYGSFRCEGLTSNTDDIVYCENCYFSAPIYLTNELSIRMICSGCNIQQCNSTNYFAPNSVAEFREVTEHLKNASGSKIEKGTLVAYGGDRSQVRPMTEDDDASIYAGFTIGDTEPNEECTVIKDGFYRYIDGLAFGTKYGVSNGKPSKTADNKIGICVGGGFIHLTARY